MSSYKAQKIVDTLLINNKDMEKNIGRTVRFKNPNTPGYGEIYKENHKITSIQKNYKGDLCYRVSAFENDFGRIAEIDEIEFIPSLRLVK